MADIVLKDRNGEDVTYTGIDTVTFDTTTEGEQATYVDERLILTQAQADWAQTDEAQADFIKNKPAIPSIEGLASEEFVNEKIRELKENQAQADWSETDEASPGFILNKPEIPSTEGLASTEYVDQKAKEITENQAQANWEQTDSTQKDYIKNKPTLAKVATEGTYAALKDRLFGDVPAPLVETEVAFALDEDLPNYTANIESPGEMLLGETYKVVWDGTEYTCVCTDGTITEGWKINDSLSLGNKSLLWDNGQAEDTGEPFYINWSEERLYLEANDTAETHTISITPVNAVQKLDSKYLPDGIATEEFVERKISEIDTSGGSSGSGLPTVSSADDGKYLRVVDGQWAAAEGAAGGSVSTETDIFPEQTLTFSVQSGIGQVEISPAPFVLVEGETYRVVLDGTEYELVCELVDGFLNISYIVTDESGEATSGSFAIQYASPEIAEIEGGAVAVMVIDSTEAESHTLAIYQKTPLSVSWENVTDKPFYTTEVTLFDGQFQDTLQDNDGDGTNDAWAGEMVVEDASDAALVVGRTYKVTWEGMEYECECFLTEGLPAVGNMLAAGGENTGEPFVIARDVDGTLLGVVGWFALLLKPPTDLTISGLYTCKIVSGETKHLDNKYLEFMEHHEAEETGEEGYTIKEEYLPGPPEFDLTAMGLPDVATGDTHSVTCDTTALRSALDKGAVKLHFSFAGTAVSGIVNAFSMSGTYQCGIMGYYNAPLMLCFMIEETKISSMYHFLATATTAETTT